MAPIPRKLQSAQKTPRYPNYRKRAASNNKGEQVINRAIFQLSDEQIRRVFGASPDRQEFKKDVEFHFQRTRPVQLFIDQNPNIIMIMGKEAAQDRKYYLKLFLFQFFKSLPKF